MGVTPFYLIFCRSVVKNNDIAQKLEESSPIHTFIFSVAYHKIDPFVKPKSKGIDSPTIVIKKLWQFTQEYVRGLHELAKNIVQHSGQGEDDGQGMITIRAYSEEDETKKTDKPKVLETHVFDFGNMGIIPKLKEYTVRRIIPNEKELSDSQKKVNQAYKTDVLLLDNFTLNNFIENKTLEQQKFRHIGHYGINKLQKLVEKEPLNGEMFIATKGVNGEPDYYGENAKNLTLQIGTHYYFRIPFNPDNFGKIDVPFHRQQEFSTLGSSDALQKLIKKEIKTIDLDALNSQNKDLEEFNGVLNIAINKNINKELINNIDNHFGHLLKLKQTIVVALNLDNCTIDGESNLLRFLGYLTEEYKQSFVIYNLDFDVYKKMIDDNKAFAITRKWEAFWNKDRGMLVFTKIKTRNFYFADILYGRRVENYYSVNKTLGNTFPNSVSIVDKEMENTQPANDIQLSDFFNNNAVLPYDILLKCKERELFLFNIKTILQNNLFRDSLITDEDKKADSIEKILENYIDNFEGYRISDTHFKIGNKVHSADFYYAKRLFQNSFYTTRLAMHLAKQIDERIKKRNKKIKEINKTDRCSKKFDEINKITLAGYEMYSELILSLTEKFLVDIYKYGRENVSHFIAQNEDDKLIFLPKNKFEKYLKEYEIRTIIIIVPIAATGSTAQKIEKDIKGQIYKHEKHKSDITEEDARDNANKKTKFFKPRYNILLAQPEKGFINIKNQPKNQVEIVNLLAQWYNIKNCPLCYGIDENGKKVETKPLFDTDNSSLTPSLIFGNPEGQTKSKQGNEVDNNIAPFDGLKFQDSINYQSVARNNNYRIYDIDSDIFIEKNETNIIKWLEYLKRYLEDYPLNIKQKIVEYHQKTIINIDKKERNVYFQNNKHKNNSSLEAEWVEKYVKLYKDNKRTAYKIWSEKLSEYVKSIENDRLKLTDRIVIVAPCHESNSQFLNLINEYVFSSSATIIHHQNEVDFVENFSLLNKNYLMGEDTKIFFVDDSLITGKHFFELFDLIRGIFQNSQPLTASILLNDQAVPFIHNRAVRWSKNYFAFSTYNQPPTLNMHDKRPLEHEHNRYKSLQKSSLHDVLCEHFCKKANKLNPDIFQPEKKESKEKQIRRLKMFEATHKIYNYFIENRTVPDLSDENSRSQFVDFKLEYDKGDTNIDEKDTEKKALLKVLSQYPFILYKDLRVKTFIWHKELISQIPVPDGEHADPYMDYDTKFSIFKFRFRRAAFLGNYQVLEEEFLKKLLTWFCKIDLYFDQNKKDEFDSKEKNLRDFPIFVLGNYVEMIQKNAWVAYRILENAKRVNFESSKQGRQFFYMLQMEAATVVDDFMRMINKEYRIGWRDMYKGDPDKKNELITTTKEIAHFFSKNPNLHKTNKFELVKEIFFMDKTYRIKKLKPFINFLWIKQLLYADTDKNSQIKIGYQTEIDAIIDKMKGFFPIKEKIQAFFIATDGQQNPYVLSQDNYILNDFDDEFKKNKPLRNLEIEIEKLEEAIIKIEKDKAGSKNKELDKKKKELIEKKECQQKLEKESKDKLPTKTLINFLIGTRCNTGNATETTGEFVFENEKWKNLYTDEDATLKFMPSEYKWLYLIRISKLKDGEDRDCKFETQGLLGFYSSEDLRKNVLPKQLLMLLRQDMGGFIDKHHKNDEFAALRQAELAKRFAYLAGHGRQTMLRLAANENTKDMAHYVLPVMEKLQYLYATHYVKVKDDNNNLIGKAKDIKQKTISEILKLEFPPTIKITQESFEKENSPQNLRSMVRNIYESEDIENKVTIEFEANPKGEEKNYDTLVKINFRIDNFYFDEQILFFILFEMIINAKKNRWHCLANSQNRCEACRNELEITIYNENENLIIKVSSTGTQAQNIGSVQRTIPVKSKNENEGLYLISSVIKDITGDSSNPIRVKIDPKGTQLNQNDCEYKGYCSLQKNTFTVTVKPIKNGQQ